MRIHLVNPSDLSFGVAVITPRWLFVIAGATPPVFGDPVIVDETLKPIDLDTVAPGDVVGIGIHTSNVLRGYQIGRAARARGAWVIFGGIHATLFPDEVCERGSAHSVVKGDGDLVWADVLGDCQRGVPQRHYEGGRVDPDRFAPARWDLLSREKYMWASVQTVRGCPKHCSFCSVWRTDGQKPRQPTSDNVLRELVELRRLGFRFIALADDNFYPVTLQDIQHAERAGDSSNLMRLREVRAERFELMERMARLPHDMVFGTQITMEAAEDPAFLDAMQKARIKCVLIGVESVTEAGLKDVYKGFNLHGEALVQRLQAFKRHHIHVLGSFIFGLPSDRAETFDATAELAERADITFAQFLMLRPYPGTLDFAKWEKATMAERQTIDGIPISRHWLISRERRSHINVPHPTLSAEELRARTQQVWDRFYAFSNVWKRSRVAGGLRSRIAFLLISKLYRQMYAETGIAIDSARLRKSTTRARWLAATCRHFFVADPIARLQSPPRRIRKA